ncbi:DUF5615 family PIN-like protein [Methylorubrum salsuginis]|uniref:DUF5615 domain-containing protein n=1 Tax=Methylorubrum salsuginis TaxID=414703 RepID=A0A1I4D1T7_9HYPH|nr:DUF5615 family PIN-like protein [Methylorubrum salsuginis]SFK87105.1 hypothetical protein SAMN04488125_105119 [Methylorubrum salsuginis]
MNLFIDECLSDELTRMALDRGHWGSTSVKRRGLSGTPDWRLLPILLTEDLTLVTKNSIDFRGPASEPGSKGLYAGLDLHAGLICLNGPVGMDLALQKELFAIALDRLDGLGNDLTNKALEVSLEDDTIRLRLYDLPPA